MKVLSGFGRLGRIVKRLLVDSETERYIAHNKSVFGPYHQSNPDGEVLVELYTITQTIVAFAYFSNVLAKKYHASIKSFSASTHPAGLYAFAHRRFIKTYESFNSVGHVNVLSQKVNPERERIVEEAIRSVKTKEDLFNLEIRGFKVGCEIYETYLVEYFQPTVDISDPRIKKLISYAVDAVLFWSKYFTDHNVKAVVMSHGIYRYGIMAKVALRKGIPVYFPNIRGVTKYVESNKPGVADFRRYPEYFALLSDRDKEKALQLAASQLKRRYSSEVGVDIVHSTKSAFSHSDGKRVLRDSQRPKVLIATHCFFDNPHCYGQNSFLDFYEWLDFLGGLSDETDYDWYLKMHPDVLPGNGAIIEQFLKKYPNISMISNEASFLQLVRDGLSAVTTVYGSVGHELPLLGVKVVNASYNPHVAYSFNIHSSSREEYRKNILNLESINPCFDEREVYEFYYTHYYLMVVDDLVVPSYYELLKKVGPQRQASPDVYRFYIERFNNENHIATIKKFEWFLETNQNEYVEPLYRGSTVK